MTPPVISNSTVYCGDYTTDSRLAHVFLQEENSDDVAEGISDTLSDGLLVENPSLGSSHEGAAGGDSPAGSGLLDSDGRPENPTTPQSAFASAPRGSVEDLEVFFGRGFGLYIFVGGRIEVYIHKYMKRVLCTYINVLLLGEGLLDALPYM
jgi:hypothetical protein